jgi:PIN domain nuclease of toxin-antitoxin system
MNLLDTSTILWAARQPSRLPVRVRDLLLDPQSELVISVVSAWEIQLKPALGISGAAAWIAEAAARHQAAILAVRLDHIAALQRLPALHKDPFDRLLIAEALTGNLRLITSDAAIRQYSDVQCFW